MKHQIEQNQHRISQVYLKAFGFSEDGKWKIYSVNPPAYEIELHCIDKYSAEINLFDLPSEDPEEIRHYENKFGIIESEYPTVLNCIEHQKILVKKQRDYLNHFISTLIGRSTYYENFINTIMDDKTIVNGFIEEITMAEEEETVQNSKADYKLIITYSTGKIRYNAILGTLINSLIFRLRQCKLVILKSKNNLEWITSDNPVVIDQNNDIKLLVNFNSEIYFPLSKKYLAFLFHKNSTETGNTLRLLKPNRISEIDDKKFFEIISRISINSQDVILFGKDNPVKQYLEEKNNIS